MKRPVAEVTRLVTRGARFVGWAILLFVIAVGCLVIGAALSTL